MQIFQIESFSFCLVLQESQAFWWVVSTSRTRYDALMAMLTRMLPGKRSLTMSSRKMIPHIYQVASSKPNYIKWSNAEILKPSTWYLKPWSIKAVPDSKASSAVSTGNVTMRCAYFPYVCFRWRTCHGWPWLHVLPWPRRGHIPLERRKCLHHWGGGHSQQPPGPDRCRCVWCGSARWWLTLYSHCCECSHVTSRIILLLPELTTYCNNNSSHMSYQVWRVRQAWLP